jgi:hypothetical protein
MSTPIKAQVSGTFTTDATPSPVNISIPSGFDTVKITNLTDYLAHAATIIFAEGNSTYPAGSAKLSTGSGANPNVLTDTVLLTGGFTFVADSASVGLGAAVVNGTSITQANPAVLATATPLVAGEVARVYNTTGMLQIAGMDFTIGTVVGGVSMQLAYLNSAGFGAAATAASFRKVPYDPRYYPRRRFITAITAANPAVVTMSVTHQFVVGEKVRLIVPSVFGMTQMNNQLATITAINTTTNTITLDIDSSAFTAFAFPTSAIAALGINFAQVVPVGEAATSPYQNLLDDATRNLSQTGVKIDSAVLVASKNYSWIATKGQTI